MTSLMRFFDKSTELTFTWPGSTWRPRVPNLTSFGAKYSTLSAGDAGLYWSFMYSACFLIRTGVRLFCFFLCAASLLKSLLPSVPSFYMTKLGKSLFKSCKFVLLPPTLTLEPACDGLPPIVKVDFFLSAIKRCWLISIYLSSVCLYIFLTWWWLLYSLRCCDLFYN